MLFDRVIDGVPTMLVVFDILLPDVAVDVVDGDDDNGVELVGAALVSVVSEVECVTVDVVVVVDDAEDDARPMSSLVWPSTTCK